VKRTANGDPTYYIYDGDKPILEYRSNGQIARNLYGKGVDEILMRTDPAVNGGQAFYFQQDHEGSVTHLTNWNNGSGQIIERYRYDVFGAPIIYAPNWTQRTTSSYNNRFLFTGREYAGAWVYEYRARIYHSYLGRFMSEDPKGFDAGDYNLFRYCHNDPIDLTDPMGTETQLEPGPTHNNQTREMDAGNAQWAMAKWADSSNNFQGTFAKFSAGQGLTMGRVSQGQAKMHTYSLKPQYSIGDLSGRRGYYYVSDPDPNCSGQCMTTVQHMSGTPSSRTPLLRGEPVGPNTKQGTAIATGFELRDGQWTYPSRPARESDNHAAFYVAPIGRGLMQTLEAQHGMAIHLGRQQMENWYEITSRLPPSATSTSQLRPSGSLYGPFY
jgi:RHS repeat-associated protein